MNYPSSPEVNRQVKTIADLCHDRFLEAHAKQANGYNIIKSGEDRDSVHIVPRDYDISPEVVVSLMIDGGDGQVPGSVFNTFRIEILNNGFALRYEPSEMIVEDDKPDEFQYFDGSGFLVPLDLDDVRKQKLIRIIQTGEIAGPI